MHLEKYIEVWDKKVVGDLESAFRDGSRIFPQDPTSCHKAKEVTMFMQEKWISALDWPGNSPDLNPIGNLWSIFKLRFRSDDCATKTELIEAIIRMWYKRPSNWSRMSKVGLDAEKSPCAY